MSIYSEKFRRLERLAVMLDSSIPLGTTGYRIGLDPLIGLIPGVGDAIGIALSGYIIWEAAKLGASRFTLARMIANVAVESIIGVVPLLGDLFDFAYRANNRNIDLLRRAELSAKVSPVSHLVSTLLLISLALLVLVVTAVVLAVLAVAKMISIIA